MARPNPAKSTQDSFGFRPVNADERTALVGEVFAAVAPKYDLMNDLMSLGLHRLWKRDFVAALAPRSGEHILDLAGGTGDIAFLIAGIRDSGLGTETAASRITVCDINPAMLEIGRARAMDKGFHGAIEWREGNAEALPFKDNRFDAVTIAFGLRNVTHTGKALNEVLRVLKPGGRFFCLEFSRLAIPSLQKAYDAFSFRALPWLGEKVAGNREAYQYLAESIRAFPDQKSLGLLMEEVGFKKVNWRNLSLGVVAEHRGYKV